MIEMLKQALEAVRTMLAAAQDDDGKPPVTLSPGERSAIASSQAAAARGAFADDADVRAVWAKHGF